MPSMAHSTVSPDWRNLGGSKPMPTPAGVPVAMMVPGSSVIPPVSSSRIGIGLLPQLAVDPAGDLQRRGIGDLVGGDQYGAHGREAVQTLAEIPLLMARLQVPGGYVVEDGVAEDAVCRIDGFHVPGGFAQHHRQLRLIVQPVRKARVTGDDAVGLPGLADPLGEVDRRCTVLGEGIGAVPGGFLRVVPVVHAQADHILPGAGDGSQQLHI